MRSIGLNKINNRLKSIPDDFVNDIISYLDFLYFKANAGDWASDLTDKDFQLIQRGAKDIKNGRVFSHRDALKKISAHLKNKIK